MDLDSPGTSQTNTFCLLTRVMPKLELLTTWLALGVRPVKLETIDGYAERIDYERKGNSGEW